MPCCGKLKYFFENQTSTVTINIFWILFHENNNTAKSVDIFNTKVKINF